MNSRDERRHLQSRDAPVGNPQPGTASRGAVTPDALVRADERRNLARDLHDGVQAELLSLILRLKLAEEDRNTPPALAATFVTLEDHAVAALGSLREVTLGIYPLPLAMFGVAGALRAQATRAPINVSVVGTAPRSNNQAEAAAYFCCSEAIQNVVKHAGRAAHVKLSLHHDLGTLAARVEDDGRGFDPAQIAQGSGLSNIRERVQTLDGTFTLTSAPGRGTALSISLPWPTRHLAANPQTKPVRETNGSRPSCSC
jgi:signal transduction histidine kinase